MKLDFKNKKRIIFHRALNETATLVRSIKFLKRPVQYAIPALEGDLCWNSLGDEPVLYLRHPKYMFDSLTLSEIDVQQRTGQILLLEPVLKMIPDNMEIVLELKTGLGAAEPALNMMFRLLEQYVPNRFWIDSYSSGLLAQCQILAPETSRTLHTEWVRGNRVLLSAANPIQFAMTDISGVTWASAIAVRYHWSKAYMEKSVTIIKDNGFAIMISRALNNQAFAHALTLNPEGVYVEVDEYMSLASQLDAWADQN